MYAPDLTLGRGLAKREYGHYRGFTEANRGAGPGTAQAEINTPHEREFRPRARPWHFLNPATALRTRLSKPRALGLLQAPFKPLTASVGAAGRPTVSSKQRHSTTGLSEPARQFCLYLLCSKCYRDSSPKDGRTEEGLRAPQYIGTTRPTSSLHLEASRSQVRPVIWAGEKQAAIRHHNRA